MVMARMSNRVCVGECVCVAKRVTVCVCQWVSACVTVRKVGLGTLSRELKDRFQDTELRP